MKTKRPRNKGELAVVAVCAVVGFLLAAQLRTVQLTGAADQATATRLETLQDLYNELTAERDGLADQVQQLQGELALYRDEAASGQVTCKDMATGEQTTTDFDAALARIQRGLAERSQGAVILESGEN